MNRVRPQLQRLTKNQALNHPHRQQSNSPLDTESICSTLAGPAVRQAVSLINGDKPQCQALQFDFLIIGIICQLKGGITTGREYDPRAMGTLATAQCSAC